MTQVHNGKAISNEESKSSWVCVDAKRIELPSGFLEWQSNSRMRLFEEMETRGTKEIKMQPSHLAVMATLGRGPFPVNLVTKGLGLIPKSHLLRKFTILFEEAEVSSRSESLGARLEAGRSFYRNPKNFDPKLLGGLEIFEGKTARNLEINSHVSLLYSGEAPDFRSFQINGVISKVQPSDPYYRFLLSARLLFAHEPFHIYQTRYPYAFLFHPVEFLDKTPFQRR